MMAVAYVFYFLLKMNRELSCEMKVLSLKELEYRIDAVRTRMIVVGKLKGLGHPDTIKSSQELDVLLNEYQKIKAK